MSTREAYSTAQQPLYRNIYNGNFQYSGRLPLVLPKTYITRKGPLMLYTDNGKFPTPRKLFLPKLDNSKYQVLCQRKTDHVNGVTASIRIKRVFEKRKINAKLPALELPCNYSVASLKKHILEYRANSSTEGKNIAYHNFMNGQFSDTVPSINHKNVAFGRIYLSPLPQTYLAKTYSPIFGQNGLNIKQWDIILQNTTRGFSLYCIGAVRDVWQTLSLNFFHLKMCHLRTVANYFQGITSFTKIHMYFNV